MANALSRGCPFPQCALYRADTERRAEFPDVLLRKPADLLQGGPAKEWYAYPHSLFFLKFYKENKGKLNFLHGELEQ